MKIRASKNSERSRFERAREQLRRVVLSKGFRLTSEREAILRATLECPMHFDAHTIAAALYGGPHGICVSTVYRAIPLMAEAGILRPTPFSSSFKRTYEVVFERAADDHLKCRSCGASVPLDGDALRSLRATIAQMHRFELTAHVHEVVGVCAECQRRLK